MKTVFVCQSCGHQQAKWTGQCGGCSEWSTLEEEKAAPKAGSKSSFGGKKDLVIQTAQVTSLDKANAADIPRFHSGSEEFDRVLGGGFVPGSLVMLSADPGSGKSTISSRMADYISKDKKVLYVAGEESRSQIKLRVERMGLGHSHKVDITSTIELNSLVELLDSVNYDFVVIDSIQTIFDSTMSSAPGTPSVLKQIGSTFMQVAKANDITMLLIGHVTKDGTLAGPNHMQHMVDVVLNLEGDKSQNVRVLRSQKNRFGATDEIGIFEMSSKGLLDLSEPNFLGDHGLGEVPGSVICPVMEGSRPVLLEVQALAQPVAFQNAPAMRRPRGIDKPRFDMLLAVLQRHSKMSLKLGGKDIYVNVSGGMRVEESAIDFAVCVAVASAVTSRKVKNNLAVWGEVSLLGRVNPVIGESKRQNEVERMGLTSLYPKHGNNKIQPLSVLINNSLQKADFSNTQDKEEYDLPPLK